MALPLTGLVSQLEPSLQGLLMQASLRWHSRPGYGAAVVSRGAAPWPGDAGCPQPGSTPAWLPREGPPPALCHC